MEGDSSIWAGPLGASGGRVTMRNDIYVCV